MACCLRSVLVRSALCWLVVLLAVPVLAGEPSPNAAPSGPKHAEFAKLFDQWKVTLEKLRGLRNDYPKANGSQKLEMRRQYQALLVEGEKQQTPLLDAAMAAYLELDTSLAAHQEEELNLQNFLVTALQDEYLQDQFETVLRLAKPLLEKGLAEKSSGLAPLYTLAGQSAFAVAEWDLAETYLKKALQRRGSEEREEVTKRNLTDLQLLPYYRQAWPIEQKLREAEAQADDLPRVLLKTTQGDIVLELYENEAPNTVANFIALVEKGFYNKLSFHRVIPAFMAQGGDPKGDGSGDAGYAIPCECTEPNHRLFFRGTLGMAHRGRNTGSSQFFLTFVPAQHLDGQHTAFGRVLEGMEVLGKLCRRDPEDPDSAAQEPDRILEAQVLRKRPHAYEPKTLPMPKAERPS